MSTSKRYETKNEEAKSAAKTASPVIETLPTVYLALEVKGTAGLIQNCFSQKAVEEMLRKHMGLPVTREKKVPSACIERATIRNTEGAVCIPPTAFKKAMLTASTLMKGKKKTHLKQQLYVCGNSIPIEYSQMVPRMDMVRTSGMSRTPDVRFRPMFEDWSAKLLLQFTDDLPVQTIIEMLSRAGHVGIGEWRPEKDGTFGTFEVTANISDTKEIDRIRKACRPSVRPLVIPEWAMNAEIDPSILEKIAHGDSVETQGEEEDT